MERRWNDGNRFRGRAALVTGGAGVLGGATARALAAEGARVALAYRGSKQNALDLVASINQGGGEAYAVQLDVCDPERVQAVVEEVVEKFGRLDVLVNAAGRIDVADAVRFAEADVEGLSTLLNIDVLGTMRMCQAVRAHMLATGGAIVNFSGSYGNGTDPENLVNSVAVGYCAAKGAIRGFTAALARDFAPTIRVNAISPGAIAADWDTDWNIPREHVDQAIAMTPLKRLGAAEEIAESALFLASDGGGFVTGQVLQVDGGWVMAG